MADEWNSLEHEHKWELENMHQQTPFGLLVYAVVFCHGCRTTKPPFKSEAPYRIGTRPDQWEHKTNEQKH